MKKVVGVILLMLAVFSMQAQYQVVILKKGDVVARYNIDDFIQYSISNKKNFKRDAIVALTDTTIVTRNDTIAYYRIRLIDVRAEQGGGITMRRIGSYLIAAAILLPVVDLVNVTLVQGDPYEFNENLTITSIALASAGALILLIDKPHVKLGRKNIIRIVDYASPLYRAPKVIRQDPLLNPQRN